MSITHAAVSGPLVEIADYQASHLIGNGTITAAQIASGVVPPLGSATPLVESGSGAAGTATNSSHEDHVHPAASSGGLAASYLGYNTAGGSTSTWASGTTTAYCKKITPGADSYLLSIGAYIAMTTPAAIGLMVAVFTDSSGPKQIIAVTTAGSSVAGIVGNTPTTPNWVDIPISTKLSSGVSYWIAIMGTYQATNWQIYRDGSGSDGILTSGAAPHIESGDFGSFASGTNKYSIRALVLS